MHFKANWNGMLTEILNNINKHNEFDINFEKNILRYIYYLLSLFYLLQSLKIKTSSFSFLFKIKR